MINYLKYKNCVLVELSGGLGNQMFQYAAGLALADFKKKSLILDSSKLKNSLFDLHLKNFNINEEIINFNDGIAIKNTLNKINKKILNFIEPSVNLYKEKNFHYDLNFFKQTGDIIILSGYFQSYLYFEKIERIIREKFSYNQDSSKEFKYWCCEISNTKNPVALHVRRGDYVNASTIKFHGSLDINYYKRAINLMRKIIGEDCAIFIFSDDYHYVLNAFKDIPLVNFVNSNPNMPWEDMFLMSKCHHNITANSTYSWWGAWMNTHKQKQVIAPAKWFESSVLSTTNVLDLYPENWILIK